MLVGEGSDHASAWRALDKALHYEVRLVHLLHGASVFADGCGNGADTHRTTTKLVDDGKQNLVVYLVEAVLVDVESRERQPCNVAVDASVALNLGKVAHASQQCVGYTWRSARASGYLYGGIVVYRHLHNHCRALDNLLQHLRSVVFEVEVDAEAGAQGRRKQSATGGCSNQRKGVEVNLYGACRGSFVYHDVDAIVFHSRVEILLYERR